MVLLYWKLMSGLVNQIKMNYQDLYHLYSEKVKANKKPIILEEDYRF